MDDAERLALGREAASLLKNNAFQAAITNYRDSLLAEFPNTAEGDVTAWRLLHQKLAVLRGFEGALNAMMTSGDRALTNSRRHR